MKALLRFGAQLATIGESLVQQLVRSAALVLLVGGLSASVVFAQTTGTIEGRILDSTGLPVVGANVVARSASLQGA